MAWYLANLGRVYKAPLHHLGRGASSEKVVPVFLDLWSGVLPVGGLDVLDWVDP